MPWIGDVQAGWAPYPPYGRETRPSSDSGHATPASPIYPAAVTARRCRSPNGRPSCWGPGALSDFAKLLRLGQRLKLLQRLVLDLADALARDVERPPDLVERAGVLSTEPVAKLEHAALAVREVFESLAQRLLGEDVRGALVGRLGLLVCDELAELQIGRASCRERV